MVSSTILLSRRTGSSASTSSHELGAHCPVDWAMSPTMVIDPDSERRLSMRSCMGDRSWASSTTMWPNMRTSSAPGSRRRRTGPKMA